MAIKHRNQERVFESWPCGFCNCGRRDAIDLRNKQNNSRDAWNDLLESSDLAIRLSRLQSRPLISRIPRGIKGSY